MKYSEIARAFGLTLVELEENSGVTSASYNKLRARDNKDGGKRADLKAAGLIMLAAGLDPDRLAGIVRDHIEE